MDIEKGHYDDRDVEKFRSNDSYVESFIRSYETMQDAANRLHESLRFRLEFSINGELLFLACATVSLIHFIFITIVQSCR